MKERTHKLKMDKLRNRPHDKTPRPVHHLQRKARQEQAKKRNEHWASLTTNQQYLDLVNRGHAHCKQAIELLQ